MAPVFIITSSDSSPWRSFERFFAVSGYRAWVLGFRVSGLGFQGFGVSGVWSLGFGV